MPNRLDITGKKYGKLTVSHFSHISKYGKSMWVCECSCGNKRNIQGSSLINGLSTSCGCNRINLLVKRSKTHGKSRTKEHNIWKSMRMRCLNPKDSSYSGYGGRGIKVCKRWLKFENFYEDMGNNPPGTSLDRKNNNKGYSKSNCRWATIFEQNNNRRSSIFIEYKGERMTIAQWSNKLKINYHKLRYWIKKGNKLEQLIVM